LPVCSKCGTELANGWVGFCPKCGGEIIPGSAYSSTVIITGSTYSIFDAIIDARNMLASEAQADGNKAKFIYPIIEQLDAAARVTKKQAIVLAASQKKDLDQYEKKIAEFRDLVQKNKEEPVFQEFFTNNPIFLDSRVKNAIPKIPLGGEQIPDFLLILHDSNHIFVEIEKPEAKLFKEDGDPTSAFTHAQQQIRNYLKWAIEDKEWLRKRGYPEMTADNVRGLVVIGKSSDLTEDTMAKLKNINAEVRSKYEIKTFDGILAENEAILRNLRKLASN